MRWIFYLVMAASVTGFVTVLVMNGFADIVRGVVAIGWALVLIVLLRLAALTAAGIAWRVILGRVVAAADPSGLLCVGLRCIREAINCLLPAAQVGGDIIGGRLIARWLGVPAGFAAASILVDLLLQAVTQGIFALIGLAALWLVFGDAPLVRELGGGLALAVPALGGFFLAQRLGLFAAVDRGMRLARKLLPGLGSGADDRPLDLQPSLKQLYAARRRMLGASVIHLVGWSFGVGEVWITLHRLGLGSDWVRALVLESLGQAVRSAAFAVPGALGIQEGGFILLGAMFGLTAQQAIILSLAKRLPDLAIGVPGLAAWQAMEASKLRPIATVPGDD
jgi:putative membrane protein